MVQEQSMTPPGTAESATSYTDGISVTASCMGLLWPNSRLYAALPTTDVWYVDGETPGLESYTSTMTIEPSVSGEFFVGAATEAYSFSVTTPSS